MRELLIGCGNSRKRKIGGEEWDDLVTIDHDPNCGADIIHDLEQTPWPVADDEFDAAHAYCVLEHLGRAGDYKAFFAHFYEIWRCLKDGGLLYAHVPSWQSQWAWGDPSHTRVITSGSLVFLNREQYHKQVGRTSMTDFRWLWQGDFSPVRINDDGERFTFILKAHKPVRFA